MSSKGPVADKSRKGDEWRSQQMRRLRELGQRNELAAEAVTLLLSKSGGDEWVSLRTAEPKASLFRAEGVLTLDVGSRAGVVPLMQILRPLPLVRATFKAGGRTNTQLWHALFELADPKAKVERRVPVAPFTYVVLQGPKFKPLHQIGWATRLPSGRLTGVIAELADDPAEFVQQRTEREKYGAAEGRPKYRWVPNDHWPKAAFPHRGRYNLWTDDAASNVSAVMCWPAGLAKFDEEAWVDGVRRLLETGEGRANETSQKA